MRLFASEIDRIVEKGKDYTFAGMEQGDRGWVFCPEYLGAGPLEISATGWDTRIFLFGPGLLPDSDFRRDSIAPIPEGGVENTGQADVRYKEINRADGGSETYAGNPSRSQFTDSRFGARRKKQFRRTLIRKWF